MSPVVRKPAFCICENKDTDQLRGNCEADQHLCFRYTDSTIPLLPKSEIFKPLAISCTVWFVSDLVGNPEDRFSQNVAHMSRVTRKSIFGVSNQVPHKPGCTATEDGYRLEDSVLGRREIVHVLSTERK